MISLRKKLLVRFRVVFVVKQVLTSSKGEVLPWFYQNKGIMGLCGQPHLFYLKYPPSLLDCLLVKNHRLSLLECVVWILRQLGLPAQAGCEVKNTRCVLRGRWAIPIPKKQPWCCVSKTPSAFRANTCFIPHFPMGMQKMAGNLPFGFKRASIVEI